MSRSWNLCYADRQLSLQAGNLRAEPFPLSYLDVCLGFSRILQNLCSEMIGGSLCTSVLCPEMSPGLLGTLAGQTPE